MNRLSTFLVLSLLLGGADFHAPAGNQPANRRPGATTVLPGGRFVTPYGRQFNLGTSPRPSDEDDWRLLTLGLAFLDDRHMFASGGISGQVSQVDTRSAKEQAHFDLDQSEMAGSYAGDLAYDPDRHLLWVLDPAHSRVVLINASTRKVVNSQRVGSLPYALALSPDRKKLFVADTQSIAVLNVERAIQPSVEKVIPFDQPSGITVTADRIFVSRADTDSIHIFNARTFAPEREVPIRLTGFEQYRGVLPMGSVYHAASGWLLIAEAGLNAVGVLDTRTMAFLGHLPTAWFPVRLLEQDSSIYVSCARGFGTGPNASRLGAEPAGSRGEHPRSAILTFALPDQSELVAQTRRVLENNGLVPQETPARPLPPAIEHVVIVVKGNRTFDEVLGDVESASNGPVAGLPVLARYGRYGIVSQGRDQLQRRLSLRSVNVTPNQHEIAQRWAFSDNFYTEPRIRLEDVWTHLEHAKVSFRNFGERGAAGFIRDLEILQSNAGQELPRLVYVRLPSDRGLRPRPEDGYPFAASFVAEDDFELGRIVEYVSNSRWWPKTVILVTEQDSKGGVDHIDSHRTLVYAISPYAKKNYASHANTGFAGLLKTAFRLLQVPPMALADLAATDLADCFTDQPDVSPYKPLAINPEIWKPEAAGERQRPQ